MHDTNGDDQLGENRSVAYAGCNIFMICIAANSRDSLDNTAQWVTEIRASEPDTPIMLVMTKSDLVELIDDPVTKEDLE